MALAQNKPNILRVLMLGFSPVVREGLRAILSKDEGIEVVESYSKRVDALTSIRDSLDRESPVNVVLTESRNSELDGVQTTRQIKDEFPDIAVLVLTENPNNSYVIDAIHAGAGGYIFFGNACFSA